MSDRQQVVLCVDDDPDARFVLRAPLEASGYEVVEAEDCRSAMTAFKSRRPDAVIVDLMMEEIDSGLAFVKDLQGQENTAPVFLLSSQGDNLAKTVDLSELKLAGILQKPLQPQMLLSMLKTKLKESS